MPSKGEVSAHRNVLGVSGLNAVSVTGVDVWVAGSVFVVEINFTGGPCLIKFRKGQCEVGGDGNWGTGTLVLGHFAHSS